MSVQYNSKIIKAKKKDGLLTLNLSSKKIQNMADIIGLDSLTNLQVLNLDYNQITEITGLETVTNLQELSIQNNQITGIRGVASLANLRTLNLGNNQIIEIKNISNLVNLENLRLEKNKITEIEGLENLVELKRLNLSSNHISEFKGLENLHNLESLYCYDNPAYKELTEVFGLIGPTQVLEHLRKPVEERELLQKSGPTYIPRAQGTEYCDRCQKYVKPKSKFGATFWCVLILLIIFVFTFVGGIGIIAIIGLCIGTAIQSSKCSVCKKKLKGASPPSNVKPISPSEMNQHSISQTPDNPITIQTNAENITTSAYFCPNCGNPVKSLDVPFCTDCGSQIKN